MKDTIRLTRFCSKAEYRAFLAGRKLRNYADHWNGGKGGSTSRGVCFTADDPKTAWRYLKGIVCPEVCMVLDVDRESVSESSGKYVDYEKSIGSVIIPTYKQEFCTCEYSKRTAKLVRVVDIGELCPPEEHLAALNYWKQKTKLFNMIRKRKINTKAWTIRH